MSWEDAWREGRTGWDAGKSSPALETLAKDETLPRGRALVPGCGSGYDVFTLAEGGWQAYGLDIAPTAAKRFETLRAERGLSEDDAAMISGNFFELETEPFDLIWDYTFLCAIEPEMREAWSRRVDELLAPNGRLVTLIFPVDEARSWDVGPPYRLSVDLVRGLLEPRFQALSIAQPEASHPGREGKEWLAIWQRVG